jgi:hypothetical protein
MEKIQIDLAYFDYDNTTKTLRTNSENLGGTFPRVIEIRSHHTGRVARFVVDEARETEMEGWDGELCEYIPTQPLPNVVRLVVYHAF